MDAEKNDPTTQHEEVDKDDHLGHLVTQADHETSKWQAIKENPICFLWCLYAVWTILLVTFENQAAGNVLGIPRFRQDFGNLYNGQWVIPGVRTLSTRALCSVKLTSNRIGSRHSAVRRSQRK